MSEHVPRRVFSENEKKCLQELIHKYKLNAKGASNTSFRRLAWTQLCDEFNSIESNCTRTENQLKKCWDNIKFRKKSGYERKRPHYGLMPSTSDSSNYHDETWVESTDEEMANAGDSDHQPISSVYVQEPVVDTEIDGSQDSTSDAVDTSTPNGSIACVEPAQVCQVMLQSPLRDRPFSSQLPTQDSAPAAPNPMLRISSEYPSVQSNGPRTRTLNGEKYNIDLSDHIRQQEREAILHQLKIRTQEWLERAAKEQYLEAKIRRKIAQHDLDRLGLASD